MSDHGAGFEGDSSPKQNRYRLLLQITDVVARAQSLSDAFQEFAPPVLALTGGDLLNLSLHDGHRGLMLTQYWKKDNESGVFDPLHVDGAASGWAWKHQKSVAISDTKREARFPGCVGVLLNHGVRSYNVLPLCTHSACFGAVGLGKSAPGETLNHDDVEFLSRVALLGAIALEKERVHHALEEQQSLVAISRELSSSLDPERLLPAILASLRSISRYDRAILALLDENGKHVQRWGNGLEWEAHLNHGNSVPIRDSLSAEAVETHTTSFFTADDLSKRDDPLAQAMYEAGILTVCAVHLLAGNRVWGTLNANSMTENAFDPTDVEYLQQVANQVAMALQNAEAYREIAQLKDRLVQEK